MLCVLAVPLLSRGGHRVTGDAAGFYYPREHVRGYSRSQAVGCFCRASVGVQGTRGPGHNSTGSSVQHAKVLGANLQGVRAPFPYPSVPVQLRSTVGFKDTRFLCLAVRLRLCWCHLPCRVTEEKVIGVRWGNGGLGDAEACLLLWNAELWSSQPRRSQEKPLLLFFNRQE